MWSPDSWRGLPALQQPEYPASAGIDSVLEELRALPLVTSWEIVRLREQLAEAAEGRQFVLQGGDCAERFVDCTPARITNTVKVLLHVARARDRGAAAGGPDRTVRGADAEPRSANLERDGVSLPSYRGDNIDRPEFTEEARRPDPQLRSRGYERAALMLNFVRALVKGGFADLHHPEYFDLGLGAQLPAGARVPPHGGDDQGRWSLSRTCSGCGRAIRHKIDFFTAHEALHLGQSAHAACRVAGSSNLHTHFPWARLADQRSGRRAHRVSARDRESGGHQDPGRRLRGTRSRAGGCAPSGSVNRGG
jgi:3-deoxy-7-phosphoheptulonate synthase